MSKLLLSDIATDKRLSIAINGLISTAVWGHTRRCGGTGRQRGQRQPHDANECLPATARFTTQSMVPVTPGTYQKCSTTGHGFQGRVPTS